jgi:hypothetical protein
MSSPFLAVSYQPSAFSKSPTQTAIPNRSAMTYCFAGALEWQTVNVLLMAES